MRSWVLGIVAGWVCSSATGASCRPRSSVKTVAGWALRRFAPMAFAEVSTHALVTHDASDQVTAAAREVCIHHLPPIRGQSFGGFPNSRTEACAGESVCHRWGRAYPCLSLRDRALMRACTLHRRNRHRALTPACPLRCLGVGSGNGRLKRGSSLGF